MSSPPPWVRDGPFSLSSPTNSLGTTHSPTPSLDNTRSAFSPVDGGNHAQVFPLAQLHSSSQSSGSSLQDKTSLARNQGQVKRSPKDHWLILPPEFESTQSSSTSSKGQGQGNGQGGSGSASDRSQKTKMETEFPVDNASPKMIHRSITTNVPPSLTSSKACKDDKNKSNLSVEKFTKDLKEKESLNVRDNGKTDDVSPGQELLKLVDSFTEKYVIDKNDGFPQIKPQGTSPGGQTQTSHQVALMESDSDDSNDSSSHRLSHDFSCASTVSLNELLEKELDEMETPGDEDFSVNNLPIYMVEDISIDDFEDFADIGDAKQIYDQCLVERKFEIKDGVLVARSIPREESLVKKQCNNNTSLENHNEKGTPSPERPNSLKLSQSNSKCTAEIDSSDNESDKRDSKKTGTNDKLSQSSKKVPPPKVLPKPKKRGTVPSVVEKCKSGAIPKVINSGDVTPVMVASNHSNSSSSPDSAMQGSFTSTSSSEVCGAGEKLVHRGDDGYASNSTVSTSLNDLHKDCGIDGKFSRTPSVETRSTMSTPHSEVTSVLGRGELSRDRRESQCSAVSQTSIESNSTVGKVKDMKAYFEQRVEELTQEATNATKVAAADRDSLTQLPNYIKIEPKMTDSNESATMMFSSCDSEAMTGSFIIKKTASSLDSSDMSNSQKTLTPQDSEAKSSQCIISQDDSLLLQRLKPKIARTLKHSLSDSNISQGRLIDCPGYLKSLHSQLARVYCLAESLKVSAVPCNVFLFHFYSNLMITRSIRHQLLVHFMCVTYMH